MSIINVTNVSVLNNPTKFDNPFQVCHACEKTPKRSTARYLSVSLPDDSLTFALSAFRQLLMILSGS